MTEKAKQRREPITAPAVPRAHPIATIAREVKNAVLDAPVKEEIVADLRRDSRYEP